MLDIYTLKIYNCKRGDKMCENNYIAIIGDIVESKKIKDRIDFQRKFKAILDIINEKYGKNITSKFMITLGDEFQGLLSKSDDLFEIIFEIEKEMRPIKIRFGIGIGPIYTDINPEVPLGADGPAYHYARKMVDKLKSRESKYKNAPANILIETEREECNLLLESILELTYAVKSRWTDRQIQIIEAYKKNDENQYKVAEKLAITQSTVNKAIKASMLYQYNNGIESIKQYLSKRENIDV